MTSVVAVAATTSPVARTSATPLTTWWVRPDRRRSVSRAAAASGGLPQISSSVATSVSTPSTISPSARAGGERLAQRVLARDGLGRAGVLLDDVDGPLDERHPELLAGSRGAGASGSPRTSVSGAQLREEEGRLARRRLVGVRAVDHVLADLEREVAADRARRGLERVGRADDLARGDDGLVALEDHGDQRAGGDELDELAEERLALVLGVVLLGEVARRAVMCLSATMRRPLRSKRAMISPVRPRANASGLTRMRVRSMGRALLGVLIEVALRRTPSPRARARSRRCSSAGGACGCAARA